MKHGFIIVLVFAKYAVAICSITQVVFLLLKGFPSHLLSSSLISSTNT